MIVVIRTKMHIYVGKRNLLYIVFSNIFFITACYEQLNWIDVAFDGLSATTTKEWSNRIDESSQ